MKLRLSKYSWPSLGSLEFTEKFEASSRTDRVKAAGEHFVLY